MKRYLLIGLLSVVGYSTVLTNKVDWLILLYMAGNNDLYSYALNNVAELEQYGSNNNATVILQLARANGTSSRYMVCKGHLRLLESLGSVNSGSASTLSSFLIYGINNFPACKRACIIWDHGTGYVNNADFLTARTRSICYDQTYRQWISSVGLLNAFKKMYQCTNCVFDIIAFDACLMQMLETETLVAPYASFVVGSQAKIPDQGYNYALMLKPFQNGTLSAANFAKQMVADYYTKYKDSDENYTLSAVEIDKMWLLERNCDTVARLLLCCLNTQINHSVSDILFYNCLLSTDCLHFTLYAYIDLARWYEVVLANLANFNITNNELKILLANALRYGLTLLSSAVTANTAGNASARALGISICFPPNYMYPSYTHSPFACINCWIPFLERYFATWQ